MAKNLKDTSGKPEIGLLPSEPLFEIAKAMSFGARKYKSWDWINAEIQNGKRPDIAYAEAAIRHFLKFTDQTVSDLDPESKLCHLAMGMASGMIALWHWLKCGSTKHVPDVLSESELPELPNCWSWMFDIERPCWYARLAKRSIVVYPDYMRGEGRNMNTGGFVSVSVYVSGLVQEANGLT